MTIAVSEFCASTKGPALLFFGAIHGNEVCGTKAIERLIAEIKAGKILLQKGSLTLVPVANPHAYAHRVRFVEENLNRIFRPIKNPTSIEARLARVLCRLVDRSDVLIDIHSTTAPGEPFIYLDFPTRQNHALAEILGPDIVVSGWPELYKKLGPKHRSFETTAYAAKQGKDCLLVECGQHAARSAPTVAYNAILNTLRHYGLIKGRAKHRPITRISMSAGFFRQHAKDRLAQKWRQFDKVLRGEPIIFNADRSVIHAPYDAYIIMPKDTAEVGQDWLYLGR